MKKKIFILVTTLTVCLQFVSVGFQNVYAVTNNDVSTKDIAESTNLSEKMTVDIVGVEGETQSDISLGTIQAPKYTGYTFVNATVDGDVINYIGTYKGDKYYANTEISDSAVYLLGDLKVKLNYTKEIKVYDVKYTYDADVMNVIGAKNADADSNLKFRIEFNEGYENYQVTSVIANNQTLTIDEDGYYVVQKIQANVEVKIYAGETTQYHVDYKNIYMNGATFTFDDTVKSGQKWTGTIFSRGQNGNLSVGALNSIILNGQYLDIPTGSSKDETIISTLNDGTKVSVRLVRTYYAAIRYDFSYTITIENVKSNLYFVPARYISVNDIAITSMNGLEVYHWTGDKLQLLEVGDMIKKNNTTDVFFVKTKVGYEAVNLSGAGSKIIERLNTVDKVENVPGGYVTAKVIAEEKGCNYVMYYSDSSVKHRTMGLSSQRIDYSVVYDMNDAESEAITDTQKYNVEENKIITVSAIAPTKKGYTFMGWKNKDDNIVHKSKSEIVINEKLVKTLKSNVIKLEAQWVKDEEMQTSSYQIQYYFEQEDGSFVENKEYRKTIENAYIGRTVILNNHNPIKNYEFDESNQNNVLTTEVKIGDQTPPLKAYYVLAKRTLSYDKGTTVNGNVPDAKTYLKNTFAKVSGNTGNLVGSYKNPNDAQFVCWKVDSTYYFANDEVKMSKDLVLTPVFVGDLNNNPILNFISGENGTITGQTKFAVPSENAFGKVILDEKVLPKATANNGYTFAGWYNVQSSTGSIATTNTQLYNYIKDLNETMTIRAQFVKDNSQTHKLSYKVEYYKGDTLDDAKNSRPTDIQTISDTVWVGDTTIALKYDNNKYEGYAIELTDPTKLPDQVGNNETIKVYYTREAAKWTTVKFIAGNGLLNGSKNDIETDKVLIGKTFDSQAISIPTVEGNIGWIFNGWNIQFDKNTVIQKDMVLTAQYLEDRNHDGIPDINQYIEVVFNAGEFGDYKGQREVVLKRMLPGDKIDIPVLKVEDGYTFTRYDSEVLKTIPEKLEESRIEYTALYIVTPTTPGGTIPPIVIIPPVTPNIPLVPNAPIEPAAPNAPIAGVVANVPAVDNPTVIAPNEVPQGNANDITDENQTIESTPVPQGKIDGTWALINLIFVISTVILAGILFVLKSKNNAQDSTVLKMRTFEMIGALIALISVVVFFVTENISMKMVMTDDWTIIMLALVVVQVVLVTFKKIKNN